MNGRSYLANHCIFVGVAHDVTRPGLADGPVVQMYDALSVRKDRVPHLGMIVESSWFTEWKILMRVTND